MSESDNETVETVDPFDDFDKYLDRVERVSELELQTSDKMMRNHLAQSQLVITNIGALRALDDDALTEALAVLEAVNTNPTLSEGKK